MSGHPWAPTCERPAGLVTPCRIDPTGRAGPTRAQARGRRWERTSHGHYVPSGTDRTVVEQRILEQAVRLPPAGAVSGWAALRWRGAAFFDGTEDGGRTLLPVLLHPGGVGNLRPHPDALLSREHLPPVERDEVAGIGCAVPRRAVFDEMRRTGRLRPAVVVLDMAAAAGLITVEKMRIYVGVRNAWPGVQVVRDALALATDFSRSPQETRMRLTWVLDCGFPPVLTNRAVFDREGRLLGYPDLLDPVAGVVGEYDGADHLDPQRRARDLAREEAFRDAGLEYFSVVSDDMRIRARVVDRMTRARARARFEPEATRRWTLAPPPWWTRPLHR